MIRVVHPGSRILMLTFSHPGFRIQGSKRYPIPDPDPQHCLHGSTLRLHSSSILTLMRIRIRIRLMAFLYGYRPGSVERIQRQLWQYFGSQNVMDPETDLGK
jgi:hypothetical protein